MNKPKSILKAFAFVTVASAFMLLFSACGTTKSGCPGAITLGHAAHYPHA